MSETPETEQNADGGSLVRLVMPLWRKTAKAWKDLYHLLTVHLRDHPKHSRKNKVALASKELHGVVKAIDGIPKLAREISQHNTQAMAS